jgi:hypothetical protein
MAKYLALWEVEQSKIPIDPKQKGAAWGMLMAVVRQDLAKGVMTNWGMFVGETNGFCLMEGTELEVMNSLTQYVPFVIFQLHPVATESQVNEMIKVLTGN